VLKVDYNSWQNRILKDKTRKGCNLRCQKSMTVVMEVIRKLSDCEGHGPGWLILSLPLMGALFHSKHSK